MSTAANGACTLFTSGDWHIYSFGEAKRLPPIFRRLDHRGIVLNSVCGALAHLGLARAYAMQGDTAKARAKYEDFLTLWKDADPEVPILQQAKAEYARLQ